MGKHAAWIDHVAHHRIELCLRNLAVSDKLQYAVAYVPSFARFPALEDSLSRSEVGFRFLRGDRPARLTTERYIKDQASTVPCGTRKLYQTAPALGKGEADKVETGGGGLTTVTKKDIISALVSNRCHG